MGKKTLIYLLLSIALFLNPGLKAQDCEWLEVGGGSGSQILAAIHVDDSNNVISCGDYYTNFTHYGKNLTVPTSITSGNGLLVKHDNNGTFKWVVQTSVSTNGNFCQFSSVKTDNQNNIYVLAFFRGTVNFGNGVSISSQFSNTSGLALVKYNTNGIAQWVRDIAPTNSSNPYNLFGKVTVGKNNTVFVGFRFLNSVRFGGTSQTLTSNGGLDIGVVKYSSSGAYQSSARFGSTSPDQFSEIDCDAFDNIYISGYSYGSFSFGSQTLTDTGIVILKTDSALSPIVARKIDINFQGSGGANASISVQPNGKCLISCIFWNTVDFGGVTLTSQNSLQSDLFIAYFTNNLNAIWVKKENKLSSLTTTFPFDITYKNGFIYLGGFFNLGNTSFGSNILTFNGSSANLFISKMDTLGNFLWAFGSKSSGVYGISADDAGNTYACGVFSDSITIFNRKSITNQVTDFFLAKITDYSITRGNVNPGPYCAGDSFKIPYTKTGRYDTGNVFIAQLSDSAGNFDGSERELGRIADTAGGEIKGVLPLFDVATTNKYRIRIISTKPVVQSFFRRDTLRLLIYSKDTANAGPDRLVCRGEPIRLGTTGGSKWQWSPATFMPNKADINNRQPLIVPDSALEYRIIISDSSGCGLTDTDYVKINLRPDLDIQVSGPSSICRGQLVTLRAKPTGGDSSGYYYQWLTVGIAGAPVTADSLVVSPDTTTTYRLVLGDSCTAKNDTVFFTLQVDSVLKVFVINDTTICKGTKDFPLSAWGSGCDTSQYKFWWTDVADTSTLLGNSSQLLISPNITTNYRVVLQDTGTMLSDTAFVKVSVDNVFIATVTKDTTICKGQSLVLEAGAISCDTSQLSFVWNNGLDTFKSHTVTPNITTTYTLIVTNKFNGLKDTTSVTVTVRPPLKVTVNADTTICLGETAELRATASGGNVPSHSILWAADSGLWTANTAQTTVSPQKTTTYRAVLTDGCTVLGDSAEIKITVRDSLKITVNADTTICLGESAELRAVDTGGYNSGRSVVWREVGGQWSVVGRNTVVNPISTTTYRAVLSDNCTKINDSAEIIITVRQPLNVTVNGLTNACVDDTVTLTAQATGGDSTKYSYLWKLPDNSTQNTQKISVNPTTTSNYTIIVGDNCSTPGFDSVIHTINIPAPISIITNNDTTLCDGWSVPLSVTVSGGVPANYAIIWEDLNTGSTNTNSTFVITPNTSVKYSISVDDDCSFPVKDTVNITVLPSPKADFSLQNNIGCEPLQVTTQDLSTNHDTLFNVWKTNTTIREGKQPPLVYPQAGTYNVALVVKNSLGCADSSTKTAAVVVHPLPVANFTVSPIIKQIEEEIIFTNVSSNNAINYKWLLGENDSIETQDKLPITKIYNDTGNFTIQLIAKTQNNCEDTATTFITLVDLFTVTIPNAFTPNGDFLNDIFTPVNTGTLAYKMTLFNRWGEVIYYCECAEGCPNPCTWDGNYKGIPLQEGTYFYILNLEAQNRTKRNIMGSVVLVR